MVILRDFVLDLDVEHGPVRRVMEICQMSS